ncbi:unnamed protein product [Diplocarpon coronariae]
MPLVGRSAVGNELEDLPPWSAHPTLRLELRASPARSGEARAEVGGQGYRVTGPPGVKHPAVGESLSDGLLEERVAPPAKVCSAAGQAEEKGRARISRDGAVGLGWARYIALGGRSLDIEAGLAPSHLGYYRNLPSYTGRTISRVDIPQPSRHPPPPALPPQPRAPPLHRRREAQPTNRPTGRAGERQRRQRDRTPPRTQAQPGRACVAGGPPGAPPLELSPRLALAHPTPAPGRLCSPLEIEVAAAAAAHGGGRGGAGRCRCTDLLREVSRRFPSGTDPASGRPGREDGAGQIGSAWPSGAVRDGLHGRPAPASDSAETAGTSGPRTASVGTVPPGPGRQGRMSASDVSPVDRPAPEVEPEPGEPGHAAPALDGAAADRLSGGRESVGLTSICLQAIT